MIQGPFACQLEIWLMNQWNLIWWIWMSGPAFYFWGTNRVSVWQRITRGLYERTEDSNT